jgi:hypothetical protein
VDVSARGHFGTVDISVTAMLSNPFSFLLFKKAYLTF